MLYGPTLTICVKVMSTGVHNIAFSHTPDVNYHFELAIGLLSLRGRIAPAVVRILTTVIGKHTCVMS